MKKIEVDSLGAKSPVQIVELIEQQKACLSARERRKVKSILRGIRRDTSVPVELRERAYGLWRTLLAGEKKSIPPPQAVATEGEDELLSLLRQLDQPRPPDRHQIYRAFGTCDRCRAYRGEVFLGTGQQLCPACKSLTEAEEPRQ
jgi:hypothetical protein